MYKEAIKFHKIALPIFLAVCIVFLLIGCDNSRRYYDETNNLTTIHNVMELSDICNDLSEGDTFDVDDYSRVTINEGDCTLTVELNGEDNESY